MSSFFFACIFFFFTNLQFSHLLVVNNCRSNHCTHQCLLVPNGHRCSCPDGRAQTYSTNGKCAAAFEESLALPHVCECRNGGACTQSETDSSAITCICPNGYAGKFCEDSIAKTKISSTAILKLTPSLLLFIIVLIMAGLVFGLIYVQKRNVKTYPGGNQAVSFRSGTNVEFVGHDFSSSADSVSILSLSIVRN